MPKKRVTSRGKNESGIRRQIEGAGERELVETYRTLYQDVYRAAYSKTKCHEDAEDVAQTLFIKLLQREVQPDLKDPKAYLCRAAVNEAVNLYRSREPVVLAEEEEAHKVAAPAEVDPVIDREQFQRVEAAVAKLGRRDQMYFYLRFTQGYSVERIAELIREKRTTVAMIVKRVALKVKKLVEESEEGHESKSKTKEGSEARSRRTGKGAGSASASSRPA